MKHTEHLQGHEAERIHSLIREVPNFPKDGILFRDINPMLADAWVLDRVLGVMATPWKDEGVEVVLGLDARGFVFAPSMGRELGAGFQMVRKGGSDGKPGKLPPPVDRVEYRLEYGTASFELPVGTLRPRARVLIVDDVLATGGSAGAVAELVRLQNAIVVGFQFAITIDGLGGATMLLSAARPEASPLPTIHSMLTL